jgi:hypothetical protein
MYVCMYVCMYIYIHIYTHIGLNSDCTDALRFVRFACLCECVHTCTHTHHVYLQYTDLVAMIDINTYMR